MRSVVPVIALGAVVAGVQTSAAPIYARSAHPTAESSLRLASSQQTVLYNFQEGNDGGYPLGGVVADGTGKLYGTTTQGGGSRDDGTVFRLTPSGSSYTETVLYRFRGGAGGARPSAGVTLGKNGTLFGTTLKAGKGTCGVGGCGTVYELLPKGTTYKEKVLYSFLGGADGASPNARLLQDGSGALYGAATEGGSSACINGCGVIFKLSPGRSGYTESVAYAFQGGADGRNPETTLIADSSGSLYGTTNLGGGPTCNGGLGCGTVYKLTRSGATYVHSVLYDFQGGKDGALPLGSLLIDKSGALYGTAAEGGVKCHLGCGLVYQLTPSGSGYTESVLYTFGGGADGSFPVGNLTVGSNGVLYGVTQGGGASSTGTVFALSRARSTYTKQTLVAFDGVDGSTPVDGLLGNQGYLYGTTEVGGQGGHCPSGGCGVVYRVKP